MTKSKRRGRPVLSALAAIAGLVIVTAAGLVGAAYVRARQEQKQTQPLP